MHQLTFASLIAPAMRAEGSGFSFNGQFRINMTLDPGSDFRKFEYRQYIKGTCTIQRGTFGVSGIHSRSSWRAIAQPVDGAQFFQVPGGLPAHYFTEDGQSVGGTTFRFGYRTNPPANERGSEDRYLPTQANGDRYTLVDTYGIRGARREIGLRITFHLFWQGRIIDASKGNAIVKMISWDSSADDIIG